MMSKLLTKLFLSERVRRPQVLAGLLLLAFLGQCVWLVVRGQQKIRDDAAAVARIQAGLEQIREGAIAGTPYRLKPEANSEADISIRGDISVQQDAGYDTQHSPLWYLSASAPLAFLPQRWLSSANEANGLQGLAMDWLARSPSLVFGLLLGASLWYVSRRLYGNAGGFIALSLYCFSPMMIRSSSLWFSPPEMGAAWGAFGAIFTAIAVAHTLYAPREVVLWNWRRILLLGLSLVLAIGSQFSLWILIPCALMFMLYLAPTRRWAALVIWCSASVVTLFLLYGSYFFHPSVFVESLRHAQFSGITWKALGMLSAYRVVFTKIVGSSPVLIILLPIAFTTYILWRRVRYFGNTAPLLLSALLVALAVVTPHYPALGFQLVAVPFLFVFVAGIVSDLLETQHRSLVTLCLWSLLAANALWNLVALARLG
ncbi:MAG: hypothetical protein NVS1B11_20720 [Terriglobales bacterium]